SAASSLGAAPAGAGVHQPLDQDGDDDDRADRRALPVGRDIHQIEAVADQHHDEYADQGADHRAAAAEQAGAADHHGGDGVELQAGAGDGVDRQDAAGEEDRGDGAEAAGDDIDQHVVAADPQPGDARGLDVGADRIDRPPALGQSEIGPG